MQIRFLMVWWDENFIQSKLASWIAGKLPDGVVAEHENRLVFGSEFVVVRPATFLMRKASRLSCFFQSILLRRDFIVFLRVQLFENFKFSSNTPLNPAPTGGSLPKRRRRLNSLGERQSYRSCSFPCSSNSRSKQ